MKQKKKLKELTIKDNFMFGAVMSDEENKESRDMEERFMILEEMLQEERAEGKEEGKAEGKAEGQVEYILELLEELGPVPEELCDKLMQETDLTVLKGWFRAARKAETIDHFLEMI